MKKFYTLALVALVTLSAAAGINREARTLPTLKALPQKNVNVSISRNAEKANLPLESISRMKAASRADELTVAAYAGTYFWEYLNMFEDIEEGEELNLYSEEFSIIVEDEATGKVTLAFEDYDLEATINIDAQTLTIPNKQIVGKTESGYDVYFNYKGIKIEGEGEDEKVTLIDYEGDATVGKIEGFDVAFDPTLLWALSFIDSNNNERFYSLTAENAFTDAPEWTLLNKGTFVDNLIFPFLTNKANTKAVEVEILYSEDVPGYYRVVNPLKATLEYFEAPEGYTSPTLELDVSDPELVVFAPTFSGLSDPDEGYIYYLSTSYFSGANTAPDQKITLTEEGTDITITFPPKSVIAFGTAAQSPYYGAAEADEVSVLKFSTDQSGIENVAVDNNAPVEYFNLQGMRVNKPANGIFIKRQGTKSTKVMF